MYIPQFVIQKKLHDRFFNLMLNCSDANDFKEWLTSFAISNQSYNRTEVNLCVDGFTKARDYTLLSPYYFVQSKNDPENELKWLLTKYVE